MLGFLNSYFIGYSYRDFIDFYFRVKICELFDEQSLFKISDFCSLLRLIKLESMITTIPYDILRVL